jgi:hypothetical protein
VEDILADLAVLADRSLLHLLAQPAVLDDLRSAKTSGHGSGVNGPGGPQWAELFREPDGGRRPHGAGGH